VAPPVHVDPERMRSGDVDTGMGDYGPNTRLVRQLLDQISAMSLEDAADLYRAHGARFLVSGYEAERAAVREADRVARNSSRHAAYQRARRDAALAWRRASPGGEGPWLMVRQAITNAAGALVIHDLLDDGRLVMLVGPWRQAMGSLTPVGPGQETAVPARLR
jgi:hypothetical protein